MRHGCAAGTVSVLASRGQSDAVGGSWRAIARLDMERRGYPMTVLHEYRMTPDDVLATAVHEDVSTAEAWAAVVVSDADPAPVTWVLERDQ